MPGRGWGGWAGQQRATAFLGPCSGRKVPFPNDESQWSEEWTPDPLSSWKGNNHEMTFNFLSLIQSSPMAFDHLVSMFSCPRGSSTLHRPLLNCRPISWL